MFRDLLALTDATPYPHWMAMLAANHMIESKDYMWTQAMLSYTSHCGW